MTLTATARCGSCDWTAAGAWPATDKAADKHTTATGHATATQATPKEP